LTETQRLHTDKIFSPSIDYACVLELSRKHFHIAQVVVNQTKGAGMERILKKHYIQVIIHPKSKGNENSA